MNPGLLPSQGCASRSARLRRVFRARWALTLVLGLSGCPNAPPSDEPTSTVPTEEPAGAPPTAPLQASAPPLAAAADGVENEMGRAGGATAAAPGAGGAAVTPPGVPAQAVIEVAGQRVVITLGDARALQTALLGQLGRSSNPLKDQLLTAAQGAIQIEPQRVQIGRWALQDDRGKLVLYHRLTRATFFRAEARHQAGNWFVEEPVQGELLLRPSH